MARPYRRDEDETTIQRPRRTITPADMGVTRDAVSAGDQPRMARPAVPLIQPVPQPAPASAARPDVPLQTGGNVAQQADRAVAGVQDAGLGIQNRLTQDVVGDIGALGGRMGVVADGTYGNSVQQGVAPDVAAGMFGRPGVTAQTATAPNLTRGGDPIQTPFYGGPSGMSEDAKRAFAENQTLSVRQGYAREQRGRLQDYAQGLARLGDTQSAAGMLGLAAGVERPGASSIYTVADDRQQRETERIAAERGANDPRIFQSQEATRRAMLTQDGLNQRQERGFKQQESMADRSERFKTEQAQRKVEVEGMEQAKQARARALSSRIDRIDDQIRANEKAMAEGTPSTRERAAARQKLLEDNRAKAEEEYFAYLDASVPQGEAGGGDQTAPGVTATARTADGTGIVLSDGRTVSVEEARKMGVIR